MAPGRWDSSNSVCSRTSTMYSPFRLPTTSCTSPGSTSRMRSFACLIRSVPEAIASKSIATWKAPRTPKIAAGKRPLLKKRPGRPVTSQALKLYGDCRPRGLLPIWGLDPILAMHRPRMTRSADSLLGQVLAANVVLVVLTILAASLAAGLDLQVQGQRWEFLVLAMAMVLTLCVNMMMLKRRFRPLERLIDRLEQVDPAEPATFEPGHEPFAEIDRLAQSFRALLGRIEEERRRSGRLVLRAQEE